MRKPSSRADTKFFFSCDVTVCLVIVTVRFFFLCIFDGVISHSAKFISVMLSAHALSQDLPPGLYTTANTNPAVSCLEGRLLILSCVFDSAMFWNIFTLWEVCSLCHFHVTLEFHCVKTLLYSPNHYKPVLNTLTRFANCPDCFALRSKLVWFAWTGNNWE